MVGIILCGHGGFASGLEKAMLQIIGEQENFAAIDFSLESSTARLTQELEATLALMTSCTSVVFLTDILGGTPFRVSALLSQGREDREVITGTNLQLLLEMVMERDTLSLADFRREALLCGHRGLTCLTDELQRERCCETEDEGI
ncbi:PTS galactosamine/N-acetylgalactosamine transporter subunit IIA [Providencia sp. Me31A]|uniref:PTS galactosamine/N-acetylgalactosamine transporter subunit IIA n=1 Tax=Providencia sp. Me31A TaxID=3392637 RepID=UPI003D29AC65